MFNGRSRRQSPLTCSSPPCTTCDPQIPTGDVDGNCVFDVRDVSFLQRYYLTLVSSGAEPTAITLLDNRRVFTDADLNGEVNINDVVFMLRVNFRLLRFATLPVYTPVELSTDNNCLFSVNVTLVNGGNTPAGNSSTSLIFDFANENPLFQAMFDETNFTLGSKLPVTKGPGLYGGLVEAAYLGDSVYEARAESAFGQVSVGISPVQVTFDAEGETSAVRVAAMFSQAVPRYGMINATIPLRGETIVVSTQLGYSPLLLANSSMSTADCLLLASPLVFLNTPYSASIPEDSDRGSSVITVSTSSNRPSVSISYAISTPAGVPFSVDPESGIVSVSGALDFETTSSYLFTVMATETSPDRETFTASTQVSVSITNVNDLPPVIGPLPFISIIATREVGSEVLSVNATDPDSTLLRYEISGSSSPGLFSIDTFSGLISVAQSLLQSANTFISLSVTVSDGRFSNSTDVTIDIYLPSFDAISYAADVSEFTGTGTSIAQLTLVNTSVKTFTFESEEDGFSVDQRGVVFLERSLDYETETRHEVTITANSSNIELQTTLTVNVLDENDNAPVFPEVSYNTSITSNTPVGSVLIQLEATDADSTGPNSDITYSIVTSEDSSFICISSMTGEVTLIQSVFGRSSRLLINVTATDNGVPSLNSFVTLTIEISSSDIPVFPLPPAVTASGSVLARSSPVRIIDSSNSIMTTFQQSLTKLSSTASGQLSASFSGATLGSSVTLSTSLQPASTSTAHLLHPTGIVYQDGRSVTLSVQVRDANSLTAVTGTTVVGQAEATGRNQREVSSPCTPDIFGICMITLSIPEDWFVPTPVSVVAIVPTVNGRQEEPLILTLRNSQSPAQSITNSILVELPARDIVSGQSFVAEVYGYSAFTISGFSVVFDTSSPLLTVLGVIIDISQWSIQTADNTDMFGISAILSSPTDINQPTSGNRTLLFSLRILTTSGLSDPAPVPITASVQSLSNGVEGSVVLSTSNTSSGAALFLDRNGQGTATGTVHIVPDSIVAIYPYTPQSELLNTAVLNGVSLSFPVQIFVGRASGRVLLYTESGGDITCTSSESSVVSVSSSCASLVFTGRESSGADNVSITFTIGEVSGRLPLRVYHPNSLQLVSTDPVLNQIRYSDSCRTYQKATLSAFADFMASPQHVITGVSVTDVISSSLFPANESVVTLEGSTRVLGRNPGFTLVCTNAGIIACTDFTVSNEVVEVSGLVGSVLVGIEVMADASIDAVNLTNLATIQARSEFQFEQEQGRLLVAVQYTDGSISAVDGAELTISPPANTTLYTVGSNSDIISRESGEAVGSFIWRPLDGQCDVEFVDFFLITSSLPDPISIRASVSPSAEVNVLTVPQNPAALVSTPTSLRIAVTLVFSGGQTLAVTGDSRLTITPSADSITVANGVITTNNSPVSGNFQVTIEYSSGTVTLNTSVAVVVVLSSGLAVGVHPYPVYPGSSNVTVVSLSLIEDTEVWQRAVVEVQLMLSNGTSVDVTHLAMLSVDNRFVTPDVQLSNNILSISAEDTSGIIAIEATFGLMNRSDPITIDGTRPVRVTGISIVPLLADTLRGIVAVSSHQLSVNMTLSDGTQLPFYPTDAAVYEGHLLPGVISFNTSSPVFQVSDDGELQPLANSHFLVSITATAGTNPVSDSYMFRVNLDPGIGDVDLGMESGSPFPDVGVGAEVTLPVVVNTGGSNLGSIDLLISYDTTVLEPLEVTTGPGFSAGVFEASLNDPPGEIRFGGALSVDASGVFLHLFNLRLRAVGVPKSAQSSLSGSILTFAERDVMGTPIGPPTPRDVVAGNITFTVAAAGNVKRSVSVSSLFMSTHRSRHRYRRQTEECSSPPCSCSGLSLGDADGNCVFDIRDVSFTLLYITQGLLTSGSNGSQFPSITSGQLRQLDPNQDRVIDTSDAFFLLRALFRLVYFLERVAIVPIQDPSSGCLFTIEVELAAPGDMPLGEVEVFVDFGFIDPVPSDVFANITAGSLLTRDKGSALLNGGIVQAELTANGTFVVQLSPNFVSSDIGVSVIIATFDATNSTSPSRSVQFFGRPPLQYPFPLSATLEVRSTHVLVAASAGYTPFLTTTNTLASSQCSDVPLLESTLNITFVSPFQAELAWSFSNLRPQLDSALSRLRLIVTVCPVDQTGQTRDDACSEANTTEVNNPRSYTLTTSPFTTYFLQIEAPTTATDIVEITSPEATPTGVGIPLYSVESDRITFQWQLPESPNGIITHYSLYLDTNVVFNGSSLSYSHPREGLVADSFSFFLQAHNSAGTATSETSILSLLSSTGGPVGVGLQAEEVLIICVVVTTAVILFLLVIMLCAMACWKWNRRDKKMPAFLSSNFDDEIVGVVSSVT